MSLTVNPDPFDKLRVILSPSKDEQAPPCGSTLLTTLSLSKGGRGVEWVDSLLFSD
jgi:hypothetical protein